MKTVSLLLIISLLTLMGCEKIDKNCPDCILKKTREFIKGQTCDTGASVSEWLFQGESVYMFADGTCGADFGASVLNQDCGFIGNLGGFAGVSKINGVDFYQNATRIRIIWQQD